MPLPLEQFVKRIEDSGLIAAETLKDFLPPNASPKSAEELALELVRKKKLTKFQAEEVSKGKGKSLFLGNYVLMEKIGAGGMGQVFKARHQVMNRVVAVKVLPTSLTRDGAAIARFHREVQAAAKLNHPNIITAHDADQSGGIHFLVMELVEGSDLSALVKKNGPFPMGKAVNYVLQTARGLEAAHKKGIVHRDIKPANLLLDAAGTVKILDMGLARLSGDGDDAPQADLTNTGTVMGTVDYMSPEQALDTKTADARADIYALGCSLFYLLTGTPTYQGDTLMKKLLAHRETPIPSLRSVRAEVPESLERIFKKMVAKKIEDRYQTMSEVITALESCGSGHSNTVALQTSDIGQTVVFQDESVSSRTTTLPPSIRESVLNSNTSSASKSVESSNEGTFTDFLDNLPLTPTKPVRAKKPATNGKNALLKDQKKLLLIGGAVLGVMILLAAVVINMRTQAGDGTLVVTVTEPDAEVEVLNEKDTVEITRKGGEGKIKITVVPGKHRLKVQKDGFEIFTESFEIKSGKSESITAELKLLKNEAVAGGKSWETPAFQQWFKDVQRMPPEKQIEAVSKRLKELNQEFDGKVTPAIEGGVVTALQLVTDNVADISPVRALTGLKLLDVQGSSQGKGILRDLSPVYGMDLTGFACGFNPDLSDLSPLRGMSLKSLNFNATQVFDLSPLKGMSLEVVTCWGTKVSDLSPMRGMKFTSFSCVNTPVFDLSPLEGMPLAFLDFTATGVSDISPLRGMNLNTLACSATNIADLAPLKGIPLTVLLFTENKVSDLSPLDGMKLEVFYFTPKNIQNGINCIRQMATLKTIATETIGWGFKPEKPFTPEEFWKKYDAGEFGKPEPPTKPLAFQMPGFDQWLKDVHAMSAEKQVEAVSKKLKELNPEFDGKLTDGEDKPPFIENGVVTRLGFVTDHVTDISPVRALTGLKALNCSGSEQDKGQLSDLSPLKGMFLGSLYFANTKVSDLSPLEGMPIWRLICGGTQVTDLSPLQGMPLTNLGISQTKVTDLSALKGMSLGFFVFGGTLVSDISPLRGMPLKFVHFSQTKVTDLSPLSGSRMTLEMLAISETPVSDVSPLEGMKLTELIFTPKNINQGIDIVRNMKTIESLGTREWAGLPAAEFWKKYDSGEFGKPTSKPLAFLTPGFDQWVKDVQAMSAEKQVEAVSKKLMELNPGFDGKLMNNWGTGSPLITDGIVTMMTFATDNVTDVSPVKALVGLEFLACFGSSPERGRLRDLSPLKGMKLTNSNFGNNPGLTDVSPLKDMPFTSLHLGGCQVTDLSTLRGMALEHLWIGNTNVSDLSPLKGMPLKQLMMWGTKVEDLSPLKGMELGQLIFAATPVADLSPLKGMPLVHLTFNHTRISDLSPLKGMPLAELNVSATSVSDLSPLEGMNLNIFQFTPKAISKGVDVIRQMKSLKTIGTSHEEQIPAEEFWKKYDAGDFGKP